jgi:hypothetical protein
MFWWTTISHQGALYKSLHLLFEKRLGYQMYRPIGLDWFTHGYWKIAEPYGNAEDTIGQYLAIDSREWDSRKRLNGDYKLKDDIYHIWDPENKIHHKAITFEKFKQMQFDIVVASHPLHGNWSELNPNFVMQLGNEGQDTNAHKVLSSVWAYKPKEGQDVMYYHQEFDLNEFRYEPPTNHNTINSFVWGCPEAETFDIYKSNLPEFIMNREPSSDLANDMRKSAFGWHIKPADGFGHLLHNWYSVGRPVIIRGSYYEGKTGGLLLEDGVTCIDLDKHSFDENIELIRYWSEPDNHIKMCQNVSKRFKEVVDFDRESSEIKVWLDNLIEK